MNTTMSKTRKNEDAGSQQPPLRHQINFKLWDENAAKLREYEAKQLVEPNLSAVMNTALELFFKQLEEKGG